LQKSGQKGVKKGGKKGSKNLSCCCLETGLKLVLLLQNLGFFITA